MPAIDKSGRPGAKLGRSLDVTTATTLSNCSVVLRSLDELRPNPRSARTHPKRKIRDLANAIKSVGFIGAIVVDETGMILAGHARHAAARLLGIKAVPTICVAGFNDELIRAFILADNKFAERAGWNREILATELEELSMLLPSLDLDIALTGFELGEVDVLLGDIGAEKPEPEDRLPPTAGPAVSRRGDLWILGKHRILCGDAREASDYARVMNGELATAVFTDPPYNVRIRGHVQGRGRVKHDEFAFASGEMSGAAFRRFLSTCLGSAARVSRDGAVHFVCMDWRHIETADSGRARRLWRDAQSGRLEQDKRRSGVVLPQPA